MENTLVDSVDGLSFITCDLPILISFAGVKLTHTSPVLSYSFVLGGDWLNPVVTMKISEETEFPLSFILAVSPSYYFYFYSSLRPSMVGRVISSLGGRCRRDARRVT